MYDKQYKEAMDALQFSEDFAHSTTRKLERALASDGGRTGASRRQRGRRIARWASIGAASAAAVLIAMLGLPRLSTNYVAPMIQRVPDAVDEYEAVDEYQGDVAMLLPDVEMAAGAAPHATSLPAQAPSEAVAAESALSEDMLAYSEYEMDAFTGNAVVHNAPMNTAEYSYIKENRFVSTADEPLSTFGADVDTASYANVRAMLQSGQTPPADAVRAEEFINYFHYDYPEPTGDEPFSVTTQIAPCPWNAKSKLLLVGLQAKKLDASALPRSNLVFLIDTSGSMDEPLKLPLVQRAFSLLTEQLRKDDIVSIVTYAGSSQVLLDGASGKDTLQIMAAIDSLLAYGSTNGEGGIEAAYELAKKHFITGGNNRVILATDGDLNVGVTSEGELTRLIEQKRKDGVFLSVMGFGHDNLKDNKLLSLADHGNGNYSFIDSALEARKVLVEEMGANFFTVAKDVKLQVEFNPEKVAEYRLIGYEKRNLAAQDFSDDSVDGGEVGAGHGVTALYELIEADGAQPKSNLVYQQRTLTGSEEYLTVNVRAKAPDGDVSQLYIHPVGPESLLEAPSDNMKLAASLAELAMILRDSEFKGTASYASAAALLEGIPGMTEDPYKDELGYMLRQLSRTEENP